MCLVAGRIGHFLGKDLLKYAYRRKIPQESKYSTHFCELLLLADRFEVHGLKIAMEVQIAQRINMKNVLNIAQQAEDHCCPLLLEACVDYICQNAQDLKAEQRVQ